tara:strand:+ start:11382 stop:11663 length:282 start_codon:yes stop_codon:yes gene_type:complete
MGRKKSKLATHKADTAVPIEDLSGWKIGDVAWAKTYATQKIIYGEIVDLHPYEKQGPAVSILDASSGKYMTVLVSSLSEKQPRRSSKRSFNLS